MIKLTLEQFVLLVEKGLNDKCLMLFNKAPIIALFHDVENEELCIETPEGVYFYRLELDRLVIQLLDCDMVLFDDKQVVFYPRKLTTDELITTLTYFAN